AGREARSLGEDPSHGRSPRSLGALLGSASAENFLIQLRRLGIVGLIRLRQRLAPYASNRSSDLVGRRFCLCRLVLDYLHRMTLRRIHAKQCRAALGDLEQKQPTPDVAILEGLGAKCLLQRVELNELQGQCAAQKLIAIKLDRMPVQGRIHLFDRAAMISGDLCHTLVDELVVVHSASLPLPARLANTTSRQACKVELGILSWKGVLPGRGQNLHARDSNPRPAATAERRPRDRSRRSTVRRDNCHLSVTKLGLLASRASGAARGRWCLRRARAIRKGRSEVAPHTLAHTRIGARLDQASAAWRALSRLIVE